MPVEMPDFKGIIENFPLRKGPAIPGTCLFRLGEILRKISPDQVISPNSRRSFRGSVHIKNPAVKPNRNEWIETCFDQVSVIGAQIAELFFRTLLFRHVLVQRNDLARREFIDIILTPAFGLLVPGTSKPGATPDPGFCHPLEYGKQPELPDAGERFENALPDNLVFPDILYRFDGMVDITNYKVFTVRCHLVDHDAGTHAGEEILKPGLALLQG